MCPFCEKVFATEIILRQHQHELHLEVYIESIEKRLRGKLLGTFNIPNDQVYAFNEHIIARQKMEAYAWNGMISQVYEEYEKILINFYKAQTRPVSLDKLFKSFDYFQNKAEDYLKKFFESSKNKERTSILENWLAHLESITIDIKSEISI